MRVSTAALVEDGVIFAAHVAGGLLYAGQDAFQSFVHGKKSSADHLL